MVAPVNQQTNQALIQAKVQAPQAASAPAPGGEMGVPSAAEVQPDPEIVKNLEMHLNQLPPDQKQFLVQNLNPATITVLGIVAGKEVYDYFSNAYQVLTGAQQQPNSGAPQGQPNQAQPPAPMAQPQPQAAQPQAMATPPM